MELYILSVHAPFNWRNPLSYISAGIRAVTRFKWHHSAFLYINDKGERVILESDIDGVVSVDYKDWAKNKDKYPGKPSLPRYKPKSNGRYNIIFTNQNCKIKECTLIFPKVMEGLKLKTKVSKGLQHVRIKPNGNS